MAGGNLPFGLAPSGQLTSYTPTLRERATDWMRRSLFTDDRAGQGRAEKVMDVASMTPFGFGLDVYDAGREAGMGNYGAAATTIAMAGAPGPSPKGIKANSIGMGGKEQYALPESPMALGEPMKTKATSPHVTAETLSKMLDEAGLGKFEMDGDVYKTVSIEHSKAPGSNSTYLHFETPSGELATVRISDHSNAPDMGTVRRQGSRQETPAIDLRPGDDLGDVVERLKAFFDGTLRAGADGRLPKINRGEGL